MKIYLLISSGGPALNTSLISAIRILLARIGQIPTVHPKKKNLII